MYTYVIISTKYGVRSFGYFDVRLLISETESDLDQDCGWVSTYIYRLYDYRLESRRGIFSLLESRTIRAFIWNGDMMENSTEQRYAILEDN